MSNVIFWLAKALVALALILFGITKLDLGPDPQQAMILSQNAWAIVALCAGCFLGGIWLWQFFSERRFERRLATELQRAGGDWRETDADEVLTYLESKTAWAYRRYARINFWEMVAQEAPEEFRRLTQRGKVKTSGEIPDSTERTKPIPDGHWRRHLISTFSSAAHGRYTTLAPYASAVPGEQRYYHVRVSTDDYLLAWPRASLWLRLAAPAWVLMKKAYFRTVPDMPPFRWHDWRQRRRAQNRDRE